MGIGVGPGMPTAFTIKAFSKGQKIFREGQDGSYACIINSGKVAVNKEVKGEEVTLAILEKGAVFGEMALISTEKRTATVVALEYTEVVVVDRARLNAALQHSVPLVQALVRGLVERLASTSQQVRKQELLADQLRALANLMQAWTDLNPPDEKGAVTLPLLKLLEYGRATMRIPPPEMEELISQLEESGVIKLERTKKGRQIILEKPAMFMQKAMSAADALAGQAKEEEEKAEIAAEHKDEEDREKELEGERAASRYFMDIFEMAQKLQISPETVCNLLARGQAPSSMVYFNRGQALKWLAQVRPSAVAPKKPALGPVEVPWAPGAAPAAAGQPPAPAAAPPAEAKAAAPVVVDAKISLANLEKLLEQDKYILQTAFRMLGRDSLFVLLAGAPAKARKLILSNFTSAQIGEIKSELSALKTPSPERLQRAVELLATEIAQARKDAKPGA